MKLFKRKQLSKRLGENKEHERYYKLLKEYDGPENYFREGTIKSASEWEEIFPGLNIEYTDKAQQWFNYVPSRKEEIIKLCRDIDHHIVDVRGLRDVDLMKKLYNLAELIQKIDD